MKTLFKLSFVFAAIAVLALFSGGLTAFADGPRGGGPGGMGGWGGPQNSLITVAAKTLGMTQADLVAALQGNKSIADVAKDKGIALDKIVDAFVATRQDALKTSVTSGRLTQAQADSMIGLMKANVLAQLNQPFTPQGPGFTDSDNDGQCDHCGMMGQGMMGRGMMGQGMQQQNGPRWGR